MLKGAYLASAVYSDLGLRTMGDIDILVHQEHVTRVEQQLLSWGFLPGLEERVITPENYHFRYSLDGNRFEIELHWKLMGNNFPFQIDVDAMWNRAQPVTLAQVPALAFSPEDTLLYLCLHSIKHAYKYRIEHDTRIRTLCDIGEVVRRYGPEMDWQAIAARSHEWGAVHAVYMILRLAGELLDVPVPAAWLASSKPDNFDEKFIAIAQKETFTVRDDGDVVSYDQKPAAQLWGTGNAFKKLTFFFERLFQSRESMASMYPAPADSWRIYLYYPVRFKDMLIRHSPMMWRLFRADQKITAQVERTNQLDELHNWLISG
jgi:Uncharacterised nucleotidyltransferase